MTRSARPLALLTLAVLAVGVAGAVAAGSAATAPVVAPAEDGPEHLAIADGEVAAHNVTTPDLDVGTAIAADSVEIHANHSRLAYQRALSAADSDENRSRLRERAVADLEAAAEQLRTRNAAIIEEYASGEVSADTFVHERARIISRAAVLEESVLQVEESLPFEPAPGLTERINALEGQLVMLQGQLSVDTATALRQGDGDEPLYVEVSDTGYTLATIRDGSYVRETFLGSAWNPEGTDQFQEAELGAITAASARAGSLYSWVNSNHQGGGGIFPSGTIYRTSWVLPGGEMTVFIDGATREAARETQMRALSSFETTRAVERVDSGVSLTLNRTYEGGPAQVTLAETPSGDPVDGEVTVGNRAPVSLEDGTHWFVDPRAPVTVNASGGGADFSVTLDGG